MQSKKQSIIESIVNTLIGYIIAVLSQMVIFPVFGIEIPLSDNLMIALYFTVVSLLRSYLLRRYFNKATLKWQNNQLKNK